MTTATVVGSGPNGLAAALTLADAGVEVTVVESSDVLGGGTRSSELTLPGLLHDECSGFHPLALGSELSRRFDLAAAGLTWRWPEIQFSHPLDDGRGAALWQSVAATADSLGADGASWQRALGPLTERFDTIADAFLQPILQVPRHPFHLARFGAFAALPATVLGRRWETPEARGLFAGAAAHAFRPLTSIASSAIGVALTTAAHRFGWPVAEGGSSAISHAMIDLAKARGAMFQTGRTVTSLAELHGSDIVMLDTSPAAAARLAGDRMPPRIRRAYSAYRHGPGSFKVDFAVEGGVPWRHEPSRSAGTVHLGGTLEEIAATEQAVHRGQMPEHPFVLVGQQFVADPSRSAGDLHPLYAYAHVPAGYTGDATAAIIRQIERFAPGFRDRVRSTRIHSTTAIAADNANFIGGDIVTGANDLRQLVFRPRVTRHPYATGIPGTYLCSAATPPGAGAHGMCGLNAAVFALSRA